MKPERWKQINDVLLLALERETAERPAFIREAGGSDEELRREVESLLSAHKQASGFIEEPVVHAAAQLIAADHHPLIAGRQIDHYRILSMLGTGGMGEVYLAHDMKLSRHVAIKLLPARFTGDRARLSRFQQEARAASALNHPNIMTIYELGEIGSSPYMATEFVDGETLTQCLTKARLRTEQGEKRQAATGLGIDEVLDISIQLASALGAAHAASILHRDIKPDNIMVRRDGYIKVLDFGIAKLTDHPFASEDASDPLSVKSLIRTKPGEVLGTASYMSPEQLRGLTVDARTDIWSAGVVLYEMITGHRPFEDATTSDVIALILQKEPPALAGYAPQVPPELARIILKALRKSRHERYQSIEDMAVDLKGLKDQIEFDDKLERALIPEPLRERLAVSQNGHQESISSQSSDAITSYASSASQASHSNNLSAEISVLIHREEEVAAIEKLLSRDDIRLVTLTGVGGVGKTRLAQRIAHVLVEKFADGVFFIDLSSIRDQERVIAAIAQALGVAANCSTLLAECLKAYLRVREMLLMLDNFEQVMAAAPIITELLASSAKLKVLVTSRALLHLSGEHGFTVQPLGLPPADSLMPASELIDYPAIAMFAARAGAVKSDFALTDENARSVAAICARLDGLPLAIELAAVRVKLLSPQAIFSRLEHSLELLTGGARDLPERQHNIRGAIAWSFDLLDEGEKRLLERLAAFPRDWTLEAAEAVCAEGEDSGMGVLDGIASLVDKSLLMQKEQGAGEPRFRMLGVVREYTLECLSANGEMGLMQQRHASYFLALAERAEPELAGADSAHWSGRMEQEYDNLRAAIQWSLEHDVKTALRLTVATRLFWLMRGHLTEARRLLEKALEMSRASPASVRSKALNGAGWMAMQQGDYESAGKFYEESLHVGRAVADKREMAIANRGLGTVARVKGDFAAACRYYKQSLEIGKQIRDQKAVAESLTSQGELARTEGNYPAARALYEKALTLSKRIGNLETVCANLINLGAVAYHERDFSAAHVYYGQALAVSQEASHKLALFVILHGFAALAMKRGDLDRAGRLSGAAEGLRESIGYELDHTPDRSFHDHYVSELRAVLGEQGFSKTVADGRAMKMKHVITLALEMIQDGWAREADEPRSHQQPVKSCLAASEP